MQSADPASTGPEPTEGAAHPHARTGIMAGAPDISLLSAFPGHPGAAQPDPSVTAPGSTPAATAAPFGDTLSAALRLLAEKMVGSAHKADRQGVELTLAPEELGRIRLTLNGGEGRMTVTVVADRADTLELLRRNIDMLAQDFRDLGYAQTQFSFGEGESKPPAPSPPQPRTPALGASFATGRHLLVLTVPLEGLDLRI